MIEGEDGEEFVFLTKDGKTAVERMKSEDC
jgi:hypothetical protein